MKILYSFSVDKEQEVEEKTQTFNEQGEKITVTKTVKKPAPVSFALKRPNRVNHDDADLYYHSQVSKGLSAGLLPVALISKRLANDGGIFTEEEKKEFDRKHAELYIKKLEFQRLSATPDSEKKPDHDEKLIELQTEMRGLVRDIQKFELENQSMFSSSAEHRARSKTIVWWLAALLYKAQGEGWTPFFEGSTVEDRIENWNKLEDEDLPDEEVQFQNKVINQALSAVSVWYHLGVTDQEGFAKAFAELGQV